MAKIVAINGGELKIGDDSGNVTTVPASCAQYVNPSVGDVVELYRDGESFIVTKKSGVSSSIAETGVDGGKKINKHVFAWVFAWLLGGFGVDRFMRGQIGTGVCKILFGWLTCGIWLLVDWIIALTKAYGSAFSDSEFLLFDKKGKYIR